ncbi:progesterone receptor isoform X3 [Neolamprologus brichardi]|uniref:progesterone receptor isoform X3 n=1 Tax=Neolamprologus brichardi TaxID=32507 RepID=UPI0003EBB87C|nr:progesterone receptor isoform X3 [Neolamprologus brichardi]
MENKTNGKMGTNSTSVADSTETSLSDVIEAGYSRSNTKLPADSRFLNCMSSVRNFGNVNTLIQGLNSSPDCAVFKDCNTVDPSLGAKHFYDRNRDYLKCDGVPWEDFVKLQRTNVAASESLPGASLPSTSGACKFIKDEKEPSVIMDIPCHNFDPSPEISALDTCSDTDRKQHFGFSEGESTSFASAAAVSRPGLEVSPNFLMDLNQSDQLVNPMQASPGETQYWGQSAGVNQDPFRTSGYNVMQNQTLPQRNPSAFSTFPGMPPQRLCMICSDEASGCHYGVLTCGSCKVFFKRAVEGHHSYLCAGRNDCIVDKIRRKNCPACRLRKCYQAGMMLGGRKLKRFGALKDTGLTPSLMFRSHLTMPGDSQALTPMSYIPGIHELQVSQQMINILENIEPEMVYSGHDTSQPDAPHLLLTSLNRLCEKQLMWIVKWSKSLPGFRNLHINDQMTLIQYSWMNIMVFSLGWRSFQNVTSEYLYFAPDLVLNQEQMRRSPIYDLCLAIQFIPQEFANLQVTREEFLCMKAIILLNTVPLEGLKSQAAFDEMRQNYIRELTKAIHMKEKGIVACSQRFYHLTKLMDAIHDIVKKVSLFCLSTFIQADAMKVEFPEMMSEVITSQLPKVLAGMVRPILFHSK